MISNISTPNPVINKGIDVDHSAITHRLRSLDAEQIELIGNRISRSIYNYLIETTNKQTTIRPSFISENIKIKLPSINNTTPSLEQLLHQRITELLSLGCISKDQLLSGKEHFCKILSDKIQELLKQKLSLIEPSTDKPLLVVTLSEIDNISAWLSAAYNEFTDDFIESEDKLVLDSLVKVQRGWNIHLTIHQLLSQDQSDLVFELAHNQSEVCLSSSRFTMSELEQSF